MRKNVTVGIVLSLLLSASAYAEGTVDCAQECTTGEKKVAFTNGGAVDCRCMDDPGAMSDDSGTVYGGSGSEGIEVAPDDGSYGGGGEGEE